MSRKYHVIQCLNLRLLLQMSILKHHECSERAVKVLDNCTYQLSKCPNNYFHWRKRGKKKFIDVKITVFSGTLFRLKRPLPGSDNVATSQCTDHLISSLSPQILYVEYYNIMIQNLGWFLGLLKIHHCVRDLFTRPLSAKVLECCKALYHRLKSINLSVILLHSAFISFHGFTEL